MSVSLVISRYNEDIHWTKNYSNITFLYNKGKNINFSYISLPNIGRESHTYLYHICNNYNNLTDYTIFLQGDPFPHCHNTIKKIDELIQNPKDFEWITDRTIMTDFIGRLDPCNYQKFEVSYYAIFKKYPDIENEIYEFGPGAQFCVSKSIIHKRPLEFYKNILNLFETTERNELLDIIIWGEKNDHKGFSQERPVLSYHIERLWGLIFNV